MVAFPDIRPAAARHLLVIPRQHIPNTSSLQGSHAPLGKPCALHAVMQLLQLLLYLVQLLPLTMLLLLQLHQQACFQAVHQTGDESQLWSAFHLLPSYLICIAVRHMLEVGKLILARKDNGAISDEAIKTDVLSTGQAPLATQLQGQQTRRNPQLQTQWQSGVFKFGFHKPPFRSVDHLQ